MPMTYKAVLRDNLIEWLGDAPTGISPEKAVDVLITVLEDRSGSDAERGQRMAVALERISQSSGIDAVDAVAWEREVRAERPLLGRDD